MKSIEIGKDFSLESRLKRTGSQKVKLASRAIEIMYGALIDIDDFKEFENSFSGYAIKKLKEQFKGFTNVSEVALCEWANLDLKNLKRVEREYKSLRIELNNDLSDYILPDLTVKAITEQEKKKFTSYQKLVEVVEEFRSYGVHINANDIQNIFKCFNPENIQAMLPNIHFIKGH